MAGANSEIRNSRNGFWGWFAQRVTGTLLLAFVAAHFAYIHYALDWPLTFEDVIGSAFLRAMDLGILVLVVYHALYGMRTALFHFGVGARAGKALTPVLLAIGGALLVLGVAVFWLYLRA